VVVKQVVMRSGENLTFIKKCRVCGNSVVFDALSVEVVCTCGAKYIAKVSATLTDADKGRNERIKDNLKVKRYREGLARKQKSSSSR